MNFAVKAFHLAGRLLFSMALFSLTGCGPVIPKPDLMDYMNKIVPKGLQVSDMSFVVIPQPRSGKGAVSIGAQIKATATEDLFSAPTDPAEIKSVNDYIIFYNTYAMWTNAFLYTPYADEMKQAAVKIDGNAPIFLHRVQFKGDTFTGYCNVSAHQEAQHWIFGPATEIDWGKKSPGSASSSFGVKCVAANGPDGQAAVQQFTADEATINQFEKQFADKHASESLPLITALKPLLTGGQEFQAYAVYDDEQVREDQFTFSEYDPKTNHCRVRFRGIVGDYMGTAEIIGNSLLIFQDATDSSPSGSIAFVGNFDPKTGDVTLRQRPPQDMADEVIHTHGK